MIVVLTDSDFCELGVNFLGYRKKILMKIVIFRKKFKLEEDDNISVVVNSADRE